MAEGAGPSKRPKPDHPVAPEGWSAKNSTKWKPDLAWSDKERKVKRDWIEYKGYSDAFTAKNGDKGRYEVLCTACNKRVNCHSGDIRDHERTGGHARAVEAAAAAARWQRGGQCE
jgi:hypothetical protein